MDKSFKVTECVTWVGKIDHELQTFHGDELSTQRGSSYNAYLVRGEKTALIDTVWTPFAHEFVENLKSIIDLKEIDYVIALHGECDHSGALPELMREIPNTPVYCSVNGVKSLKGLYHADWDLHPVKTGDTLDLGGGKVFTFVEARMLHWPDNMMAYLQDEKILFSTDVFGQHLATEAMYNDLTDTSSIYYEAKKYYANIVAPFSKMAKLKLQEVAKMNLPIDMICPSHGVIWRDNPAQIIEKYMEWADDYQENKITILYDTMWNSTRRMAEAIAEGIKRADPEVTLVVKSTSKHDKNDILTDVFDSKAVLVGSPTVVNGILSSVAAELDLIREMHPVNKKAATFGSYGWSGESPKVLAEHLEKAGFEIVCDGLKVNWVPDEAALQQCVEFGANFAKLVK